MNGKSKWAAAKLQYLLQVWTSARAEIPQLGVVCMPEHSRKPVFSCFIFIDSKSQYIKLTLPLNQESDNLAIRLEGNFLVN